MESDEPIGRLAPSPTGALHLGNARSFLMAWLSIRSRSGRVILRIEDLDSPRVKAWARQATLDDLHWLGLDWEHGPDVGGPHAPYVQTERQAEYGRWLDELKRRELVYPCDCSRSEIAAAASAPHEAPHQAPHQALEGPIYSGHCRHRSVSDATKLGVDQFAWRYRASDDELTWCDLVRGTQTTRPARTLGDFLVAKGDGTPAYQLAVVVDDWAMGVTEVVRGSDLIPSTFRQIDLLQQFAWVRPAYMHLPLMVGSDGRRLAKRHGDTRLSWFRQAGYASEQLLGYLAWTAGLLERPTRCQARELIALWTPHKLPSQPTVVNLPEVLQLLESL